MVKGVVLLVFLVISIAQILPSCGGEERTATVIGWVDDKYYHGGRQSYVLVINNVEYNVPDNFYDLVEIGDLVKNEGGNWSIVRKKAR